jgi:hypothetical protein
MENRKERSSMAGRLMRSAYTLAGVLALGAGVSHAAIVQTITIGDAFVTTGGGASSFDVTLTNNFSTTLSLAAFSFAISTTDTHIQFTQANQSTTLPYVFVGDSFDLLSNSCAIISLIILPCTPPTGDNLLSASDLTNDFANVSIAAGATVGLGHVVFNDTAGDSTGPVSVTLTLFPSTSLSDALGNNIAYVGVNGTITVQPGSSVPEPSTLLLGLFAVPALLWARKRAWKSR